ncbi:MAG: hypothetical protein J3R72DRAFT_231923 [Linnemannia gamsii]|nr:MAG: hypothetical protein J3R72DRAFT_231923 [Linnemannia gamsii]
MNTLPHPLSIYSSVCSHRHSPSSPFPFLHPLSSFFLSLICLECSKHSTFFARTTPSDNPLDITLACRTQEQRARLYFLTTSQKSNVIPHPSPITHTTYTSTEPSALLSFSLDYTTAALSSRARMTNPLQYKGPPSGVEMTSEGRSTFNRLKTSAKKALFPTNKADTSLSNAVAAVHVENSRIINRFGRFAKDEPALDDSEETKASTPVIVMATTPDPFQAASPQPRRSRVASTQSSSPRTFTNPSASVPAHFQPEPLQPRRSRAASTQSSSPRTFTNPSVSAKVINFFPLRSLLSVSQ